MGRYQIHANHTKQKSLHYLQVEEFLETNETLKTLPGPVILGIVLIFIATLTSVASNTGKYDYWAMIQTFRVFRFENYFMDYFSNCRNRYSSFARIGLLQRNISNIIFIRISAMLV